MGGLPLRRELTYPGYPLQKSVNFEDDDFLISRLVGYVSSLEGIKLEIVVTRLELQFGK